MSKKQTDIIPQLKLDGEDYSHIVPDHVDITMFIRWKKGNKNNDEISNIRAFEKVGKELHIINHNSNSKYIYSLKEVKAVYLVIDNKGENK